MSTRALVSTTEEGIVTLQLDRPPGNVLGIDLCGQVRDAIAAAAEDTSAKLLVLTSAGDHFSFGASVEEHLPDQAAEMLAAMSAVVAALYGHPYPTLAALTTFWSHFSKRPPPSGWVGFWRWRAPCSPGENER